jgi:putative oxidoreductase
VVSIIKNQSKKRSDITGGYNVNIKLGSSGGVAMNILKKTDMHRDIGLLIVRLGIGASMLIFHGYGKISGGTALWEKLGSNLNIIGIDFYPVFWGFMAAFSESICSLLIMIGVLFRPAAALLTVTMSVAVLRHLTLPEDEAGAGWSGASHALEMLAIYIGLFFLGPGKYRLTVSK